VQNKIKLRHREKLRDNLNPEFVLKFLFSGLILFFPLSITVSWYAKEVAGGGNFMITGDWLINYASGFVRRGLFGEVFLNLAPAGKSSIWFLFIMQVGLYLLLYLFLFSFLIRKKFSWLSIAVVCCPAGIPLIGFDTGGFGRKEILGILSLIILTFAINRTGTVRTVISILSTIFFVISILTWEPNLIALPSLFFVMAKVWSGEYKSREITPANGKNFGLSLNSSTSKCHDEHIFQANFKWAQNLDRFES
jgi:hypothetical protein